MTIGHLLSQSSTSRGADADHVANIGNLVLVDESMNNNLADKGFKDKLLMLGQAGQVWVDPVVLNATTWEAQQITKRAEEMARIAYREIWKI